jgi:hypothetical protein
MRLALISLMVVLSGCTQQPIGCTMDAKMCPDGSAVGRIGPNCEFAPCPGCAESGLYGTVTMGPTCPAMRADEPCPDRPLSIALEARSATQSRKFTSAEDGSYSIRLPQGTYTVQKAEESMLPSLAPLQVTVDCGMKELNISLDSGIR